MRVASLMTKEGMAFRRQVDSGGDDWIGRTDFRAEGRPLILEVQSERYHSTILDAASDAARTDALAAAGFTVVEVLESEIWYAPTGAVRRVRDAWDAVEHRSR
jgi:very-short-patch-repair endonuclease